MKLSFLMPKKRLSKTDEALRQFQSRLDQVSERVMDAERRKDSRRAPTR